jgi:hypothetical protein
MSDDEGGDGDRPADDEAAADADVEAAVEQEAPTPPEEDQQAEGSVDAPGEEGPVDMPEVEEPITAPDGEEPVDAPDDDPPDDVPEPTVDDETVETDDQDRVTAEHDAEAAEPDSGGETIEVEVPANLLRAWEHQASKAKLSVSEYVVRMTEAGRMSVQMQPASGGDAAAMSVEQLTDEVVEQLRHEEAVSWDQLVDAISKNLEEQLEDALDRLQEDDVVRYSGLKGGYRLVEEDT